MSIEFRPLCGDPVGHTFDLSAFRSDAGVHRLTPDFVESIFNPNLSIGYLHGYEIPKNVAAVEIHQNRDNFKYTIKWRTKNHTQHECEWDPENPEAALVTMRILP